MESMSTHFRQGGRSFLWREVLGPHGLLFGEFELRAKI